MRTTFDLPDELFRRAKSEAALRGRKLKDLVEEGLRRVLSEADMVANATEAPSLHDLMRDCRGIAPDSPTDFASNPKYLDDFGR